MMNLNDSKIQKIQADIAKNGYADAYVTFDDGGNMIDYDEYEDDYSDVYNADGHYEANVKVFEVTDTGLHTKEYSGSEIFIPFQDIVKITF